MTDPTSEDRRRATFDDMVKAPAVDIPTERVPPTLRRRWALPAATITLALLGAGALSVVVLAPPSTEATTSVTSTPAPTPNPTAIRAQSTPAATATGSVVAAEHPVTELVDPIWVNRVAQTANIPERALASYAGASLAVAGTHPDCGIGWNTLAAIGFVESEHGAIDGSTIGADGVSRPTIIGIPLDGNGTNPVPDTDRGQLDGDTVWDRAIGPMQFIPSTWTQYAQDGNRDGVADPNNIDDAALTAAVYLCTAATGLGLPEQWIAAIHAYNPSVDYNNRVADAANHFASLS